MTACCMCVWDTVSFLDDKWAVLPRAWLCPNSAALIKAQGRLYRNKQCVCVCADKQFEWWKISSNGHFSWWHTFPAVLKYPHRIFKEEQHELQLQEMMMMMMMMSWRWHTHVPCRMYDYMSGIHCDRTLKSSPCCVKLQIKWWWQPISLPAVSMTTAEAGLQCERLVKCCWSDCRWWGTSQES